MKRSVLILSIIALATLALSGCGQVVGLVFEPDLSVDYVNRVEFDGQFVSLDVAFENDGVWLSDVEFAVFLSADEFIDLSDHWAYGDYFDIGFKGYEDTTVQRAYFNTDGLPDGDYYVGVIVDPYDEIDEGDERNNTALMNGTVAIGGGGGGLVLGPDGYEPNDDFYTYHVLPMGMNNWQGANLHHDMDVDWFEAYQMMDMNLYIQIRPGPNGFDVPVYVEVYNADDPAQTFAVYAGGDWTNHDITIDMAYAPAISQWWRIRVWSPAGEIGEYEIQAY